MKRIIGVLMSVILLLGLGVSQATPAAAGPGDLIITNSSASNGRLLVCVDWGNTSCRSTSPRVLVAPGSSTSSWRDVDGIYVPPGCDVKVLYGGAWYRSTGWHKIGGGIAWTKRITARQYC